VRRSDSSQPTGEGETRGSRRTRGFTLLELVISLLVAGLLFLLAAQLLRSVAAGLPRRRARGYRPEPRLAVAMLRRDVREALGVGGGSPVPADGPLVLLLPGPSSVRYEQDGSALLRIRLDAAGEQVSRRAVLAPLAGWRWSEPEPGMVFVTLQTVAHSTTRSLLAAGPERLAADARLVTTEMLAARRLGRNGW
jgi:prepilin-type N-terminal cleavage/methylation domain-containing protein